MENTGLAAIRAAAGGDKDVVSKPEHDAALADAATTASAEGAKKGTAAERSRIQAIVGAPEAKGREALAQSLAFDTDLAPEAAIKVMKAAPIEKASRLEGNVPNPKVQTGDPGSDADGAKTALAGALTRQLAKLGKTPKAT